MVKLRYKRDQRVSILIQIAASSEPCSWGLHQSLNPLSLRTSQGSFLGCEAEKAAACVLALEMTACLPAPEGEMDVWTSADSLLGHSELLLKAGAGCCEQAVSLFAQVPAKRLLFPVFIVDEVKLLKVLLIRMGK